MLYYARGGDNISFSDQELQAALEETFEKLGPQQKVLALPPDITRYHSQAGKLTAMTHDYFGGALTDIMPALGTHVPMTDAEIKKMFPGVPNTLFREHKWRKDLTTVGTVPGAFVKEQTEGKLDFDWPAQVNSTLIEGN